MLAEIEAAGAEAVLADPDRLATLVGALDHVAVIVLLLGSASGSPEQLAALHGPRLDALLHKLLDTTVRGVVYEAARGAGGAELVWRACEGSRIPYALIDPPVAGGWELWLGRALDAVDSVLSRA